MTVPPIIDLQPQLNAIRRCFIAYWRNPDAEAAATELWGGPFGPRETERIDLPGHAQWHAEIHLAPAPNGTWAMNLSYSYATGGSAAPITPWCRYAYPSRDSALDAGSDTLIRRFLELPAVPYLLTPAQRDLAHQMAEQIRIFRAARNQLALF